MKKISEMTVAELRARAAEIRGLVDKPDADLEALDTEATEIAQRLQQAEMEARRKAIAGKVAGGDGVQVRNFPDRVEGEGEYTADSAEYSPQMRHCRRRLASSTAATRCWEPTKLP